MMMPAFSGFAAFRAPAARSESSDVQKIQNVQMFILAWRTGEQVVGGKSWSFCLTLSAQRLFNHNS